MKPGTYETRSAEETMMFGYQLGRQVLKDGDTVLFYGDLGVGKTTCIKGIVQAFGGNPHEVVSPTFIIVNIYETRIPIYHIDLYRLQSLDDIFHAGVFDLFEKPGIRLVEWAERVHDIHRPRCIHVSMDFLQGEKRAIHWNFDSHAPEQYTNTTHTP